MRAVYWLGIAMLMAALTACMGTTTEYETTTVSDSIVNDDGSQAESLELTINSNIQDVSIQPVDDGDTLLEGTLDIYGDLDFNVRGGTNRVISVDEESRVSYVGGDDLKWNFDVSNVLPLDLTVEVNSAEATLELADYELTDLTLDTNSGEMDVFLPANKDAFEVQVMSNSGAITLRAPEGHTSDVRFEGNSGTLEMNLEAGSRVAAEIDSNSGNAVFDVPDDMPVRVDVRDNNSGNIDLPEWVQPVNVNDDDDEGVWESLDYDADVPSLTVTVTNVNSGTIRVR